MTRVNPPFFLFCGIVFLIPFFRVQLQYDFRFYIGILYVMHIIFTNKLVLETDKIFNFKNHIAFYLWILLTTFFTSNLSYSIQYLTNYFFLATFFLFTIYYITNYARLILTLKVLVASFILQIFIVIMQFKGVEAFYLVDKENIGLNTGMNEASTGSVRYWGSFGEALVLSTYLTTIGIGLALYLIAQLRSKVVSCVVISVIFFAIYLTGSRAGLSIFSILLITYIYRERIVKRSTLVLASVLFIILGYFYVGSILIADANLSRFSDLREGDMRFKLWTEGFKIIANSPLYGSTIGSLNYSLKEYNLLPDYATTINASGHVENSYLTILFSTGVVGFAFFFYIVRYPFILIKKYLPIDNLKISGRKNLLKSLIYSYTALLLCMFTEPSIGVQMRNTMLFMFINAIVCCVVNINVHDNTTIRRYAGPKTMAFH